jgi:hypothetical protein
VDALASGTLADKGETSQPGNVETRESDEDAPALSKFADVAIAAAPPLAEPLARAREEKDEESRKATARADVTQSNASMQAARAGTFAKQAPAAAGPLARDQKQANSQQQFSQTAHGQALRNNVKARAAANILDNFQVEQDGREIRLVDADGSTYTGKFESGARNSNLRMLKQPAAATETARSESASASLPNEQFFRATGFNASLKKRVVFEGNYIPLPAREKNAGGAAKDDGTQQTPARIIGKATVPGEAPVEVDAITTAR